MVTCLAGIDLFQWWAATISAGSVFLSIIGVYLYVDSRKRRKEATEKKSRRLSRLSRDFIFVWVLLGLLVFYIVSIDLGSDWIFAIGNIFVELMLIIYVLRNNTKE
jgi:ABC-type Fe3+ transport system permease subunit